MEWSRIKSILICVFAAANIFLFVVYLEINSSPSVSNEAIENTVQILKANDVSVDPAMISRSMEQKKVCGTENLFENTRELASVGWRKAQALQRDYFNPTRTVVQDTEFSYKTDRPHTTEEITDVAKYVSTELAALDLLPKQYQMQVEADGVTTEVIFYLTFGASPLFDIRLNVVVTPDGIVEIHGQNWLVDQLFESGMTDTRPMTELLIAFASDPTLTRPTSVQITHIEEGYYIGTRTEKLKITAIPALKLTLSDGSQYYYDARNGELLQYEK